MSARTKARKAALDLLFEADQRGVNVSELLGQRQATPAGEAPVRDFTADLVRGTVEHWTAINDLITTWSQGWTLERMPAVDRVSSADCSSSSRPSSEVVRDRRVCL